MLGEEDGKEGGPSKPGDAYEVSTTAGTAADTAASTAAVAYRRLEALCSGIRGELEADMRIHQAAVLPSFLQLPALTSAEYCKVGGCCL